MSTIGLDIDIDRIQSHLADLRAAVEKRLDAATQFDADCPAGLQAAIRYSLLTPGKRFRPMLALLAAEHVGSDWRLALPAACAVEMIHAYSLIHDDLPAMDDDDFRRGLPSCHKRFGEATAILAGDALIPLAFEMLCGLEVTDSIRLNCVRELAKAAGASALVGGQFDDLDPNYENSSITQLDRIHQRKTGALIAASLRIGAICGQATKYQMECLTSFGKNLGLAFQIIDDLLDFSEDRTRIDGMDSTGQSEASYPLYLGIDGCRSHAVGLVGLACEKLRQSANSEKGSSASSFSGDSSTASSTVNNMGMQSLLYLAYQMLERKG